MEYLITFFVFLIVCAGGVGVLLIVGRLTGDDETPLGDTDEHSDAIHDRRAA